MKENKEVFVKIRLTQEEKEAFKEYAEAHGATMSELLRLSIERMIIQEKK